MEPPKVLKKSPWMPRIFYEYLLQMPMGIKGMVNQTPSLQFHHDAIAKKEEKSYNEHATLEKRGGGLLCSVLWGGPGWLRPCWSQGWRCGGVYCFWRSWGSLFLEGQEVQNGMKPHCWGKGAGKYHTCRLFFRDSYFTLVWCLSRSHLFQVTIFVEDNVIVSKRRGGPTLCFSIRMQIEKLWRTKSAQAVRELTKWQ